jgi:lipoprotein-releasing system permease protein
VSKMAFRLWLVHRFVSTGRRLLNPAAIISLAGMAIGVASLTVAMGVVSGFEKTLKTAIIDVFGDIMLVKKGDKPQKLDAIIERVRKLAPEVKSVTPFVQLEGVVAGRGKIGGVIVQGLEPQTFEKVLNIRPRLIRGKFDLSDAGEFPNAMVGKTLAKRFEMEVGKTFKTVLPTPSRSDSTEFAPKVMTFRLAGILDLGKAEYDERTIITSLKAAQTFAGMGDAFSGIRLRLDDSDKAAAVAQRLSIELGPQYWTMHWMEVNQNLFEAVKIERVVIFFVILVMVIAASFNIASNLYVNVLKRYPDISILRALGFSQGDVLKVFVLHGFFFGVIGTVLGLLLGLILCVVFIVAQNYIVLLPVETYRVDHVGVDLRALDILAIVCASLFVCLLATIFPARRGAALDPVQGLRYE